ncbi:MAG TPA: DUF3617 family protein [Rhodanobacteraceae bacterium]
MRIPVVVACVGVAAGAVFAARPAIAAQPATGHRVELTVRVHEHMAGVPAIPVHTVQRKICMQAGGFDPEALRSAKQRASKLCRITHYVKDGDTVTFDQMCKADGESIASHGVFHLGTGFNFTGTTHTAMNAAGHAITVDANYAGKSIGTCTYTPAATGH